MNKLKINQGSDLFQKVESILDEKKMSFKELAKKMDYKESYLIDELNRESVPLIAHIMFIKELSKALKVDTKYFSNNSESQELETVPSNDSEVVQNIENKVKSLLKKKSISFAELARRIGYSNAGLHRSFGNNTISVTTLELIAKELDVDISYFFEEIIIEKLVDEIISHNKTSDLKNFMFGFSRDISKGLSLKEAVYKNIDPEGYKIYLLS